MGYYGVLIGALWAGNVNADVINIVGQPSETPPIVYCPTGYVVVSCFYRYESRPHQMLHEYAVMEGNGCRSTISGQPISNVARCAKVCN